MELSHLFLAIILFMLLSYNFADYVTLSIDRLGNRLSSRLCSIWLLEPHIWNCLDSPGMFHLRLLICFLLVNLQVKLTGTLQSWLIGLLLSSHIFPACSVLSTASHISCQHTFWHAQWDRNICNGATTTFRQ